MCDCTRSDRPKRFDATPRNDLRRAPAIGKYDFIRQKLIDHYADSEQRKLNRLLSEMPLGDKRPSELYHDMKRVAGNVLGEAALKGLWAQRLPEAARPVVAASTGSAAEFTRIADSIVVVLSPRTVNQVTSNPLNDVGELRTMINELKAKIEQNSRSRSHSRKRNSNFGHRRSQTPSSRSNSNNRNGNDNNGNGNDGECWYHATYGSNARHCRSPCNRGQRTPANGATGNAPANSNQSA